MQSENIRIFISSTPSDSQRVRPVLRRLETARWQLMCSNRHAQTLSLSAGDIGDADLVVAFIGMDYLKDRDAFMAELSYAACALRKPYILVALEELRELSADVEMLAAKNGFVTQEHIESALEKWANTPPREWPSFLTQQRHVFKPFEACEEQYAFVSYAHDDASAIYPVIKDLYEAGWNLWYDEGIRITERYLPEIAQHVRDCEIFLLFVTECSIGRPFVIDFELAYAQRLGKRIVPVMMDLVEQMPEGTAELAKTAPDETLEHALKDFEIQNHGKRTAVPPKDKKDEEYDLTQLTPMRDYKYRVSGDGLWLEKYTGDASYVTVPEEHCGLPIRGLSATFLNQKKISRIMIPPSVRYIGEKTFRSCRATVIFPRPRKDYVIRSESVYTRNFGCGSAALAILIALIAEQLLFGEYLERLEGWWLFGATMGSSALILLIALIVFVIVSLYREGHFEEDDLRFPEADDSESSTKYPVARACYAKNAQIQNMIDELRSEGFLINHYTGESTGEDRPVSECRLLIAFLDPEFFKDPSLVREIKKAITDATRIVPIYYAMQPNELPNEFASSIGQFQGIHYNSSEYRYLIKRALKSNGCWRDITYGFTYSMRKSEVRIAHYIGRDEIICVPAQVFDQNHVVTSMGYGCLQGGAALHNYTEVFIPETIQEIEKPADTINCSSLAYIHVDEGNPCFNSVEGVLYDTKKGRLLVCPRGLPSKRLMLPGNVKTICENAFGKCENIEEVVMRDGVERIEKETFWNCVSLESVFIPASVKKIEKDAFLCCRNPADSLGKAKVLFGKSAFFICPKLTISTPAGSYAERYAKAHNIPVVNV